MVRFLHFLILLRLELVSPRLFPVLDVLKDTTLGLKGTRQVVITHCLLYIDIFSFI